MCIPYTNQDKLISLLGTQLVGWNLHGGYGPPICGPHGGFGMVRQPGRHLGADSINLSKCVSLFTCICVYIIYTQSSICICICIYIYICKHILRKPWMWNKVCNYIIYIWMWNKVCIIKSYAYIIIFIYIIKYIYIYMSYYIYIDCVLYIIYRLCII